MNATLTAPELKAPVSLAELARDRNEYQDGRQLLDLLCHATDGIPDAAVLESADYRAVSQRIAELLFHPDFTSYAEREIREERNETAYQFPL